MLTRNTSPALRAWKYGLVLPVLTLLLMLIRLAPANAQNDKDTKELSEVEQAPQYPGGKTALMKFLGDNIKYPEAAKRDSAQGMVSVTFVIEKDGSVTNVEKIKPTPKNWRDDFVDETIRVVKKMPKWEPAKNKGKAVKVRYTLPVKFKLS